MCASFLLVLLTSIAFCGRAAAQVSGAFGAQSVLQYHGDASKAGYIVDPALAELDVAKTEPVASITTPLQGQSYAQLLYVDRGALPQDLLISTTQENVVMAVIAGTGKVVWRKQLADPVPASALPCGNISPYVGILSTPAIDPAAGAVIVSAKTTNDSGVTQQYQIFALYVNNGSSLPGFPVDVAEALAKQGVDFQTPAQLQRGGLLMLDGVAYAGYGGNNGDCQEYRGRVVGVTVADPSTVYSYNTSANKGAIWAPGGPASDGTSIFVGTGNTEGVTVFSEGNTVLRLPTDLKFDGSDSEFFAPSDWLHLDEVDLDLGTAGPVVLNLPGSTPEELVFIGGKEGIVYLLDRNDLGGFNSAVAQATVSSSVIITAPAVYNSSGQTYAAIRGAGLNCPGNADGADLIGLKLGSGNPPTITTAWCANATAKGNSPVATAATADGSAVVWIIGADAAGANTLNAYDGETGKLLYQSAAVNSTVSRYHTPIQAKGRMYLATDTQLASFSIGTGDPAFAAPPAAGVAVADAPAPAPQTAVPTAVLPMALLVSQVFIAAIAIFVSTVLGPLTT